MTVRMSDLELLERKNAIYVLRLVYENPGMMKTEIMNAEGSNSGTKNARLDDLTDAGLLICKKDFSRGKKYGYYLSDTGREVCELLNGIADVFMTNSIGNPHEPQVTEVYVDPDADKMMDRYRQ